MTEHVLINVPRLDRPGGVANFYRVLHAYLPAGRHFFEIGAKAGENGSLSRLRRALTDYWQFHRRLSTQQYSLVHLNPSLVPQSMLREAVFLLIARAHSVPVLAFFHGWDNDCQEFVKRRLGAIFRLVINRTSGLVVLATDFRGQLETMGISVPIYLLTTCVDDTIFDSQPSPRKHRDPRVNILYLSRLDHGKGLVEAIRAFALLKRQMPKAVLSVAGDGPERHPAEQLVRDQGIEDVVFLGHIDGDAKASAFLESDIFFFPTFFGEGMPTTVLEAMAYGLPVVTRSVGGLKDFFENEEMGFITESRDEVVFARMLEHLARDARLRHKIGEYNRQYAKAHFASSAVARKLEQIYVRIAG